ncbi:DUF488 family protein [Noviherbaspirillum sp.]|jgi:uncharacterized protein YeaO (DUF488 family)|uniref:DUF488 domain-containing protein n=1 Tax=Noviherbaspirillum sp. TaxID=1926288 RepID=UPI0025DB258F|nr:DUF488 family protein [Noviherbaspirillum sp.]
MTSTIKVKSVYEPADDEDGTRILVDRLWPRGVTKEKLGIEYWSKAIAPSTELRKWYGHDPEKWEEFCERYRRELDDNPEGVQELLHHLKSSVATFLFSSKEHRLNNAVALRDYLQQTHPKSIKKSRV